MGAPEKAPVNPLIARVKAYILSHIAQEISRGDIPAFVGLNPIRDRPLSRASKVGNSNRN